MSAKSAVVAAAVLLCFSASATFGQAPLYDIRAELAYYPAGSGTWVVQIRNVGPTIPGPVKAEYYLSIPAGAQIVQWNLNQMQCAPSPPLVGNVTIVCTKTLPGAWAAGTILSNQLFYASFRRPGAVRPQACVRTLLFRPDSAGNFQVAPETATINNATCA
ncbi:MAG: hypothetical protein WEB63_05355 [Cucumibacter sp.]